MVWGGISYGSHTGLYVVPGGGAMTELRYRDEGLGPIVLQYENSRECFQFYE